MKRALTALLAASMLAVAGCGSSDEDKIKDLVEKIANDPAALCDNATSELLEGVGGEAACKQLAAKEKPDKTAKVSNLKIDGDNATATITDSEGPNEAKFAKEDGDWKLAG